MYQGPGLACILEFIRNPGPRSYMRDRLRPLYCKSVGMDRSWLRKSPLQGIHIYDIDSKACKLYEQSHDCMPTVSSLPGPSAAILRLQLKLVSQNPECLHLGPILTGLQKPIPCTKGEKAYMIDCRQNPICPTSLNLI